MLDTSPHLAEAVKVLVGERLADMQRQHTIDPERAATWHARAIQHLDERHVMLTATDIKEAALHTVERRWPSGWAPCSTASPSPWCWEPACYTPQ
ncbi:MAG: hypothetical protein EXS58_14530 [Candidatus Latescibacteria bacterium]|nr:hypothetical protein [Candidatus Latescibacterota bacterium]